MRYGHVLQIACILFEVRQAASFEEGEWTEWSHWSECSVTCGYGLYKRQKTWQPSVPDTRGGGDNDPYTFEDILECITRVSCPRDGAWGYWGAWSECSRMCDGGTTTRKRECVAPTPGNGGKPCEGKDHAKTTCNDWKCPTLSDNFDVHLCNETTYMCLSQKQCIPAAKRCDNVLQCHDGSDEHKCEYFYFSSANFVSISALIWTCLAIVVFLTNRILIEIQTDEVWY
ncbi:properdin-like [Mya arenaria]|uniref:properdin-like n=1 Tax=Mya arenaria TaxID=6604 RepID=UPI0022E4F9B6|nr:properdin-like [Mya arenaria]XP_052784933.1 properdin-like [Mya arenaria]XP_052784934.1 properdin-like [Mya arenaria]XP_052784935.1 properdin-like [Mya arenaria]